MSFNEKKINATLIIEVLGRPPEHLIATLEDISKRIGEEKGVKVIERTVNPPILMRQKAEPLATSSTKIQSKDQQEFYTSFAEINVEVEEILYLVILMFKYMPANVEIISPQNISLPNSGFNDILNELTRRLHGYEEIARILQTEKKILENKLRVVLEKETPKEDKEDNSEKKSKKKK